MKKFSKSEIIGIVMLLACTIIWGCAFSFQTIAKDNIEPFFLIGLRFIIAGVVLTPILLVHIKVNKVAVDLKNGIGGGAITGLFLAAGSSIQQFGIKSTSTGKAGFLTAMYIVFVPIISVFVLKKKINFKQLLGILFTVVGVGLMSLNKEMKINIGDILCLICGFLFSFQILSVDHFSRKTDSILLSVVSFYTCGILSLILGFIFEDISFTNIKTALWPILYLGIFSSGIAYSLQTLGQKRVSGVPASLIMSMEAVFSALFALIILHELMSVKEIVGAFIMMIGVLAVQIFEPTELSENTKQISKEEY